MELKIIEPNVTGALFEIEYNYGAALRTRPNKLEGTITSEGLISITGEVDMYGGKGNYVLEGYMLNSMTIKGSWRTVRSDGRVGCAEGEWRVGRSAAEAQKAIEQIEIYMPYLDED